MAKRGIEVSESRERERGERAVRISFGAIHTYARDPRMKYVILDVGENNWFTASQILHRERLGFPGTGSLSDIDEIVGHMDIDAVLKGLEMTMGSLSPSIEASIRQYAVKSPRVLKE